MLLELDKNRTKMNTSIDLTHTTQNSANPITEYQPMQAVHKTITYHDVTGFIVEMSSWVSI